jgi:carbonic anhydrase
MRKEYFAHHPYHFIYIGCMDGRASHLPEALGIPVGCAEIFQTAGARFSTAWPYFANILTDSVEYGLRKHRTVVIIVSSHYSKKYPDHGCRAFGSNRSKARD